MATATKSSTTKSEDKDETTAEAEVEPKPVEVSEEEQEAVEASTEVQATLGDLPHDQLVRLRGAVDHALTQKGLEPEPESAPSLNERTGSLPINTEESQKLDAKGIAKKADCEPEEILSYAVRQQHNEATEEYVGPKYLRVVKTDGSKTTVEL